MALHSVELRGGFVRRSFEKSPTIALETDAASAEDIPELIRTATDCVVTGDLAGLRSRETESGYDAAVTWLEGDRVLRGSAANVRHGLRVSGRSTFVAVHVPCLEEIPFLTLQRRWFRSGGQHSYWDFGFRIESGRSASSVALEALEANGEPWAELAHSVLTEKQQAGSGVASMVRLWENARTLPNLIAALVLRNLAVLMLRHGETAKAEQFLASGMRTYAGYSELHYLAALLAVREERGTQALPLLEKARSRVGGFLGSGGESTYRVAWLMGLLAARTGNHRVAFQYFLEGMRSEPVFMPAVEELLKLRVSSRMVEAHQRDFCSAVRSEPRLVERVFEYLVLHRQFGAAERIVQATVEEGLRSRLEERLSSACLPFRRDCELKTAKAGVLLSGSFFEHSSLARINREIAGGLLGARDLELCLEPSSPGALPAELLSGGKLLVPAMSRHPVRLDLTIRHQWPPDFSRTARGKLAAIVPWEYGAVPHMWVSQIQRNVDELWVPSRFVREVFLRGGVAEDRIRVIPNGIDTTVFRPEGPSSRPQGSRGFVFLFVGGALRRKGVDLLMDAYRSAFDTGEDVTLLLVVLGVSGAYQHNSLMQEVLEAASDEIGPHVQPLLETVDDATLANLYRGCDAFVLPYRGEGFGMPLLEAMACGKSVITTAAGPSGDFCTEKTAYLIRAEEVEVPDEPPPLGRLSGEFTWFEPDFGELVQTLRRVYENREKASERGRAAARHVREEFAWSRITSLYVERIRELVGLRS